MEMISSILSVYFELFSSWWWLTLSLITFMSCIVYPLKDDDDTLSTAEAIKLSLIGIINLVPGVKKQIPLVKRLDFLTRWELLDLCDFLSYIIVFALASLVLSPVAFIFVFGIRIHDSYRMSVLSHEVTRDKVK